MKKYNSKYAPLTNYTTLNPSENAINKKAKVKYQNTTKNRKNRTLSIKKQKNSNKKLLKKKQCRINI